MSEKVKAEKRSFAAANPPAATAEDRDLDEWARRLVNRPTPQIGNAGSGQQQGTLNNFLNLQTNTNQIHLGIDGYPQHNGFDIDTAVGKFTWYTIADDKYVPCIFRCKEKFCSVKMAEISVFGELLRHLPVELYECVNLISYSVSSVEARVLTHINNWHCDGFYGAELFSTKDQLVRVEDIEKFYYFLSFAFSVLSSGGRNDTKDYSKCAFIKVNSDNLIPYTVLPNDEKGVPLFYFEGQTEILKEKAVPLQGWELAYLKVCCKVQGVRKDLIAGSTLQIVKVSDLRSYFPRRTVFTEECWPEPKMKSLLSKSNGTTTVAGFANNPIPSSDKWAKLTAYVNSAAPISNCPNGVTPIPMPPCTTVTPPTHVSISSSNSQPQSQTSVISVTSARNGSAVNSSLAVRVVNGLPNIPIGVQAKSDALKKIKVISPPQPQESSRLQHIPEYADSNRDNAYAVRLIIIDKEIMHCINMQPFKHDTYLVVLHEFMTQFFPSISIYPTAVSVLKSSGVSTYLPNQAQIRTINAFGFSIQHSWQMPLIPAVAVTQVMPKLRNVFRPRVAASGVLDNNVPQRSNGYTHTTIR